MACERISKLLTVATMGGQQFRGLSATGLHLGELI